MDVQTKVIDIQDPKLFGDQNLAFNSCHVGMPERQGINSGCLRHTHV